MDSLSKTLIAIISVIVAGVLSTPAFCDNDPYVRIAILKDAAQTVITTRGIYKVVDPKTDEPLKEGRVLRKSRVKYRDGGIQVGKSVFPKKHIRLVSNKSIKVLQGKRLKRYRGSIDIVLQKDKKILLINTFDLERYVKGVLYHEVSDKWPMQAMMAQAVAIRTYALYQIDKKKNELFDVSSDIYSQVYGGRSAERYRTNIAAKRTKSEVMRYRGKILPAYYHSNSGGHTENVAELWNHKLKPLEGVVDPYVKAAPNYTWTKNFRSKDIQDNLNKHGYKIGLIKEINILETNKSGRIKQLEIVARNGKKTIIEGKKFRSIIGPNNLKSNLYRVEMKGYYLDIHGRGWGHGVGLSQWGAHKMAQERFSHKEILEYYYPGVRIEKL